MERLRKWLARLAWDACRFLCGWQAIVLAHEGVEVRLAWHNDEGVPFVVVDLPPDSVHEQIRRAAANLDAIEKRQAEISRQQQADIAQADHGD
jgi:hypothetical protein